MDYGSLDWARAKGGALVGAEAAGQALRGITAQLNRSLRRRHSEVGFASPAEVETAMREVELPASRLVEVAHATVAGLGPPSLTEHVLRTYALGTLLGLRDGLRWDRELFALAALLHDLGLSRRTAHRTCFAHDGAEQALELLAAEGMDEARKQVVANAVCLHLRLAVPASLGVEAHLVHAGAAMDIAGQRLREIPVEVQRALLAAHPRGDLVQQLLRIFAGEQRDHPQARISRWMDLGFGATMRAHRWERENRPTR